MTLRLAISDLIIAIILVVGAAMFIMASSDSNRLAKQQKAASAIEELLLAQNAAAFDTHVAAANLLGDWAGASAALRSELIKDLETARGAFDETATQLVANRTVSSLEEFSSGEDALRQLSDLAKEISEHYAAGAGGIARKNITTELNGNYRFLFGLLNDSGEIIHDNVVETQLQIAQKSGDMSRIMSTLAIMVIVALGLRFALTLRWVLLPANRLARVTTKFADGDVTQDVPQMHVRELHQIAEALTVFRDMTIETDELRRRAYNSQKRAHKAHMELERRTRDSESLMAQERQRTVSAMADKFETSISSVVETVGSAAQELTVAADRLAISARKAGDQANQVAKDSAQANENVGIVASEIEKLSGSFDAISTHIDQVGDISESITEISKNSSASVQRLDQKAANIKDISKVIFDITQQTNSLALSAAAESSQAGGSDTKFADMADAIKNLADQTARSAAEIDTFLKTIDADVRGSVDVASNAASSMAKIGKIGLAVGKAADQQRAMTSEITDNAGKAAASTRNVSENVEDLAVAADQACKLSQYIKTSAEKLDLQALELEQAALQFAKLIRAA